MFAQRWYLHRVHMEGGGWGGKGMKISSWRETRETGVFSEWSLCFLSVCLGFYYSDWVRELG